MEIPCRRNGGRDDGRSGYVCQKDNGNLIRGGGFGLDDGGSNAAVDTDNDIDTDTGTDIVQHSSMLSRTTKLRRGLVIAGAGVAKKVVSHGRDKTRMAAEGVVTSAKMTTSSADIAATVIVTGDDEDEDGHVNHNHDGPNCGCTTSASTNVLSHSTSGEDES